MYVKKQLLILNFILLSSLFCTVQIEAAHASVKDFKATGFGGFLNFSIPVSEANYATLEGGLQYFKNQYDEELALVPVLLGYRYTLNQSGSGLYVEPNAGYCFGESTIGKYDESGSLLPGDDGDWAKEKVAGPMAGVGVGYLFEPGGKAQFNIGLRYEHTFGNASVNVFALRISHAFSFRNREEY
jgi:hypothetical protein